MSYPEGRDVNREERVITIVLIKETICLNHVQMVVRLLSNHSSNQ